MLEVDPSADKTVALAVGIEDTPGVPAKEMTILGEDRRFTLKWANSSHNALGNFLHAPTLHQIEAGQTPTPSTMRSKGEEIAAVIEDVLASPVFRVNFGQFYEFRCECGTPIKRREASFRHEQGIVCPNSHCKATYDVARQDGDRIEFRVRRAIYTCAACEAQNYVGTHRVTHGAVLVCAGCGDKARIEQRFEIIRELADGKGQSD